MGFTSSAPSVEDKALAAERVVGAYKDLAHVERAFRSLKTVDLHLRPIHHWLALSATRPSSLYRR